MTFVEVTRSPAPSFAEIWRHLVRYAPAVLLPACFGIAFTGIFTRVFDASAFGLYMLVISGANVLAATASSWLQQGITRFLPGVAEDEAVYELKAAILLCVLVTELVVLLIGLAVVPILALDQDLEWGEMLWPAFLFVLCNSLYLQLSTLLQAELRSGRYSIYAVSVSALRLGIALILTHVMLREQPIILLVWANTLSVALVLPMLVREARLPVLSGFARQWQSFIPTAKRMAFYGIPLLGWVVASGVLETSDRYVIQFFRGSAEVGIYAANYTLVASAAQLVSAPILFAIHSLLMKAHNEGNGALAGRWLARITETYIVLGSIVVGAAYLLSEDIAHVMLGPSFREGHRIIPVVLSGLIVWQWSMYAHKPLEFANRTRLLLCLAVIAAVLNIVLNIVLVPRFGYVAAAYTTFVAYMCYGLLTLQLGRRSLPWTLRLGRPLRILAICVVLVVVGDWARGYIDAASGYVWGLVVVCGAVVSMFGVIALQYSLRIMALLSKR